MAYSGKNAAIKHQMFCGETFAAFTGLSSIVLVDSVRLTLTVLLECYVGTVLELL